MRNMAFPNSTLRRLQLLVERDRLLQLVRTLPHNLTWVKACADLARTDRVLADVARAA